MGATKFKFREPNDFLIFYNLGNAVRNLYTIDQRIFLCINAIFSLLSVKSFRKHVHVIYSDFSQ